MDNKWICSCGSVCEGNFCTNCGSRRPEVKPQSEPVQPEVPQQPQYTYVQPEVPQQPQYTYVQPEAPQQPQYTYVQPEAPQQPQYNYSQPQNDYGQTRSADTSAWSVQQSVSAADKPKKSKWWIWLIVAGGVVLSLIITAVIQNMGSSSSNQSSGSQFSIPMPSGVVTTPATTAQPSTNQNTMPSGTVTYPEPSTAPVTESAIDYDWWSGDWYGWWIVYEGTGAHEHLTDGWWDCCANIKISGDTGRIVIWDEDSTENSCMIDADLYFYETNDHRGCAVNGEGGMYGVALDPTTEWYIEPAEDGTFDGTQYYDDLIRIDGFYEDDEGTLDYAIFLRPWGTIWDDCDETWLPYFYEDWYLPLINQGVTKAPMTVG